MRRDKETIDYWTKRERKLEFKMRRMGFQLMIVERRDTVFFTNLILVRFVVVIVVQIMN